MFRIECYCEDEQVGGVLRALAGRVVKEPSAQPMVNVGSDGRGHLIAHSSGDLVSLFSEFIVERRIEEVTSVEAREFMSLHGRSTKSYSNLLTRAKRAGMIRKVGRGLNTRWRVVRR